jgi:uncharacterized membrane protein
MILFTDSRKEKGWTDRQLRKHFLIRGLILICIQMVFNFAQAWSLPGISAPRLYVGVLSALGAAMIICILFLNLRPIVLAGLSLALFFGMEILTPEPFSWGLAFDNLPGTLLVYGGGSGEYWTNYPLVAWLEVAVFGLLFGKWLQRDERKTYRAGFWLGLVFMAGFGLVRIVGGFGNIRPLQVNSWTSFLEVVKYPPSMAFVLLTIGVNLMLLAGFSLVKKTPFHSWNPLFVFGRVPLFTYLAHIAVYFWMGRLLRPEGSSLGVMYVLWLAGLALLYFPARWYGRYKRRAGDHSWVRFF